MQKETTSEDSITLAIYSSNGVIGNFEIVVPRDDSGFGGIQNDIDSSDGFY
jgi:hypothetical protein